MANLEQAPRIHFWLNWDSRTLAKKIKLWSKIEAYSISCIDKNLRKCKVNVRKIDVTLGKKVVY